MVEVEGRLGNDDRGIFVMRGFLGSFFGVHLRTVRQQGELGVTSCTAHALCPI